MHRRKDAQNQTLGPAADTGDSAVSTQYCTFISVGRRCGVIYNTQV
jgi:hypothetical protein